MTVDEANSIIDTLVAEMNLQPAKLGEPETTITFSQFYNFLFAIRGEFTKIKYKELGIPGYKEQE